MMNIESREESEGREGVENLDLWFKTRSLSETCRRRGIYSLKIQKKRLEQRIIQRSI